MQISQIKSSLPNLKPQKIFSKPTFFNVSFQSQNKDTFIKKDIFIKSDNFSNEDAMQLLRMGLQEYMTPERLDISMKKIEQMCEQLGIEPKDLPIDGEHQGNLTYDQLRQISSLILCDVFSA